MRQRRPGTCGMRCTTKEWQSTTPARAIQKAATGDRISGVQCMWEIFQERSRQGKA